MLSGSIRPSPCTPGPPRHTASSPWPDTTAPIQRLTGGRLLQRIHLAATSEGIALQHMNQVTERIDREVALGTTTMFGPRFHALLAPSGDSVLSTFRVGYPARDALLSPRRPVSAVTR
jgi:hypothetical protein